MKWLLKAHRLIDLGDGQVQQLDEVTSYGSFSHWSKIPCYQISIIKPWSVSIPINNKVNYFLMNNKANIIAYETLVS